MAKAPPCRNTMPSRGWDGSGRGPWAKQALASVACGGLGAQAATASATAVPAPIHFASFMPISGPSPASPSPRSGYIDIDCAASSVRAGRPTVTLAYDLYWSFRSPYSYLITPRARRRWSGTTTCAAMIRPVYPLAVRTPEFFETRDPLWFSYFMTDIRREAEFLGMPLRWPRPDPVLHGPRHPHLSEGPAAHPSPDPHGRRRGRTRPRAARFCTRPAR